MTRYVALLRAINVGGHVVRMDKVRGLFEAIGLSRVATVIASGNVLFDSSARNVRTLEVRIAQALEKTLGYEVATFVRSAEDIAEIAAREPFRSSRPLTEGCTLHVGFMAQAPSAPARKAVLAFGSDVEEFHFGKRELHWLCRMRFPDSPFSKARPERLLGGQATFRNLNTVRRIGAALGA